MQPLSEILMANAADEETQAARMAALKDKKCLWITAPVIPMMSGTLTQRVQWVRDQGVELVAVFESETDKLFGIMKEKEFFSQAVFVDMHANDVADQIVAALSEQGIAVDSVFSPYEQCQTIVGDVGTKLGLTANPAKCYETARSKHKTREACVKAGLGTPRVGTCKTKEEMHAVVERVGFPLILKPSAGAGSCGVYRADTMEEALKHYDTIMEEMRENWGLEWNPGLETNVVLVEELLVGPEFDTDILIWDDKPVYIRTVDNWECTAPFYLETGSNMPSIFPKEMIDELEQYSLDCVRACGFTFGCYHVECIVTKEGPRLIEVNARQGGGSMQEFNMHMHEVDVFANFFISTFGIPINPPRTEAVCCMADFSITCETTGILMDLDFMESISAHPAVVRATPFFKSGDKVKGLDSGFPVWLGEFLVKGETAQKAIDTVNEIVAQMKPNIQPQVAEPEFETDTTTTSSACIEKVKVAKVLPPTENSSEVLV